MRCLIIEKLCYSILTAGQVFAMNEMRLFMAAVLLQFDLQMRGDPKTWLDQRVFSMWETKPLICVATKRG